MMFVRIKPYNAKRGNLLKSYSYAGQHFKEETGWYEVDDETAEYLRDVTADGNPDSPSAFDVGTEDEAYSMVERARLAASRGAVTSPVRVQRMSREAAEAAASRRSAPAGQGDAHAIEARPLGLGGQGEEVHDLDELDEQANEQEQRIVAGSSARKLNAFTKGRGPRANTGPGENFVVPDDSAGVTPRGEEKTGEAGKETSVPGAPKKQKKEA